MAGLYNKEFFEDDIRALKDIGVVTIKIHPEQKRPVTKGVFDLTKSEDIDYSKYRIGYITGKSSGVTILDIDIKEDGLEYFKRFCKENDLDYSEWCHYKTPSGGYHFVFKYTKSLPTFAKITCPVDGKKYGIDVRNDTNGCCVCPPTLGYIWEMHPDDCPIIRMPTILKEFLKENMNYKKKKTSPTTVAQTNSIKEEKPSGEKVYEDKQKVLDLVDLIDPSYSDDRDTWCSVILSIKSIIQKEDDSMPIAEKFSRLSSKFDLRDFIKTWDSYTDLNNMSIGTLCMYAKESDEKGYNSWRSKYVKYIQKQISKFDLDDEYNFTKLEKKLYQTVFQSKTEATVFLQDHLYKCLVRVDKMMITKIRPSRLRNPHVFELYGKDWRNSTFVQWYIDVESKGADGKVDTVKEIQTSTLKFFLEQNRTILNYKEELNTDVLGNDTVFKDDEFYCGGYFKAKYIKDIQEEQLNRIQPLLDFILEVHCNGDTKIFNILLKLFSLWCVEPNKKTDKCLVLISKAQGTGKSTLIEFFIKYIFGDDLAITLNGFKELLKDQNGFLSGKKLVLLEEAASAKKSYTADYNDFKQKVTGDKILIKKLWKDPLPEKNNMEFVICSNNEKCVPVQDTERRFLILKVNEKYAGKDKDFWTPFYNTYMNQEIGNIFYTYLININTTHTEFKALDLSCFDTEIKNDLKEASKKSVELFKDQVLEDLDNHNFQDGNIISSSRLDNYVYEVKIVKKMIRISATEAFKYYKELCDFNLFRKLSSADFGLDIKGYFNRQKSGGYWYEIKEI